MRPAARAPAVAALTCGLAAALYAADPPPPLLPELDEVQVTASRKRLPLETYVEYPEFDSVAISPGGTRLAMGWTDQNYVRLLTVSEFPSMKQLDDQRLQVHMGATDLRWAGERWLLVQPDYPRRGYLRVRDPVGSLFVLDVDRHSLRTLNNDPLVQSDPLGEQRREEAERRRNAERAGSAQAGRKPDRPAQGPVRLVAARTGTPEQSLFQTVRSTDRAGSRTDGYGAFALNLPQFAQSRVATLPLAGGRYVTGPEGRIAIASGTNPLNEQVVYYLPPEARAAGEDWQLRISSRSGERGLQPIAWTGQGEEYYALDGRMPTRSLVLWNAADGTQRLVYRNPVLDLDGYALDPAGRPWMFSGSDGLPVYWYPNPTHPLARLHQTLVKRLPGEQVDFVNASDDMSIAVMRAGSGHRTPVYLVLDVKSGSSLTGMHTYPKLRGSRLARVDSIEFQARDGLLIRGLLTTPVEADGKPRRGLPLVVIEHDGPQGQPSSIGYEFERQLFASRGYAVLQVNHRGTSGRNLAFERAGDGRWSREVPDDFADAVQWAIRDGVAAADRVCFYGERFGAFAAMLAAARAPELFQCVIGISGIYDLPAMYSEGVQLPAALQLALGNEPQQLTDVSPVSHAAAIKAKVLLIQQQRDEQVPNEQFVRMRKALADAGNRPNAEIIGQSGDGYFTTQDRAAVYARVLRFVEQSIGD